MKRLKTRIQKKIKNLENGKILVNKDPIQGIESSPQESINISKLMETTMISNPGIWENLKFFFEKTEEHKKKIKESLKFENKRKKLQSRNSGKNRESLKKR